MYIYVHLRSLKTDVVLRPIANLKALRAANTIKKSRKFCVTRNHSDNFERVSKDLVPFWTARAIHSKKIAIRSNSYGYPFEKEMSSLWLELSVWIARAIRLKNSQPFKRLTSFRNHFCPNRLWRTWQKM